MRLADRLRFLFAGVASALAFHAWGYPDKPLRLIVPYAAGGSSDYMARVAAPMLSARLGVPVYVENKAGGNSIIATQTVASAPADGHTLLVFGSALAVLNPLVYRKLPVDVWTELTPVALMVNSPVAIVVNANSPIRSIGQFLAQARDARGMTYSMSGTGNPMHLIGELLAKRSGLALRPIPYSGGAPSVAAIVAGQVDANIEAISTTLPFIRSGRLRALAVTGAQRDPHLPGVPTLQEAGLPGFDASTWFGVMARSGTPAAILDRLNQAFNAILREPRFRDAVASQALAAYDPRTRAATAAFLRAESDKWREIVRINHISID